MASTPASKTLWTAPLLLAVFLLCRVASAADVSVTVAGAVQGSDTGTITISFSDSAGHHYSESVAYGAYSTPASIASAFGAKFSNDGIALGLCAHASGAAIAFHLKGTATFGPLTISGPTGSFQISAPSWPSVGPVITGISLSEGPVGMGLIITGANFGTLVDTIVTLNGAVMPFVTAPTGSPTLIVDVPDGATSGNIVVTVGVVDSNGAAFQVDNPFGCSSN